MSDFDHLLAQLSDPDAKLQDAAIKSLSDNRPTPLQGALLIEAASRIYPNDSQRHDCIGAKLLRIVRQSPDPSYIAAIKEHYGSMCHDKEMQWQSLRVLTELKTPEALQAFGELLQRPESRSVSLETALVPLVGSLWGGKEPIPAMAALFPAWFDLAEQLEDLSRYYTVISNCQAANLVDFRDHPQFVGECVRRARRDLAILRDEGGSTPDDGPTPAARGALELEWILDLFRAMDHPEIPDIVVQSLNAPEDHVQLFAIATALRRGIEVPEEKFAVLAAKPSRRHRLWRLLEDIGHLDRFPTTYRTTELLAEANMVKWLEFPTEMGRAPAEIEHLAVVRSTDESCNKFESHFFKFRHPEFLAGKWFVGFAGTYRTTDEPTLHGEGTFSQFEELESRTIAEHVALYLNDKE